MKYLLVLFINILLTIIFCDANFAQNTFNTKKWNRNKAFLKFLYRMPKRATILLDSADKYKTQIIFTQINRDETGKARFTTYTFNADKYFYYPASLVKLPMAIMALKKIDIINNRASDYNTKEKANYYFNKISVEDSIFILDNKYCGLQGDDLKNGRSFSEYIKRMMIVSDNKAFNPLYDFVTPSLANTYLHNKGFHSVKILQRFNFNCTRNQNINSYPLRINYTHSNAEISKNYTQSKDSIKNYKPSSLPWASVGKGYYNAKDELINEPLSFNYKNYVSLIDLHNMLLYLVEPSLITNSKGVSLPKYLRDSLLKWMSTYPTESHSPVFDKNTYPANWGKYYIFGDSAVRNMPDSFRIFNKVGMAYGFLNDCAYIVDYKNKCEFVVSTSIFVDTDGILNDDKYAYNTVGFPFYRALGNLLLKNEIRRKKRGPFNAPMFVY